MKVAIMQPYAFPYIGYFQLIKAVDVFVFYDDVNFIKKGWINRNKILVNGADYMFTFPIKNISQNVLINNVELVAANNYSSILKTIERNYSKAPYFKKIYQLVENILGQNYTYISELAIASITQILEYLNIDKKTLISTEHFSETKEMEKEQRLIQICKQLNADIYINAIGGQELYTKSQFLNSNIKLNFLKPNPIFYKQFNNQFVPWLSIIDVLMFNSPAEINIMLDQFELV
jgi:hypothetical protein